MTRAELEAKAESLGIENPSDKEQFPNVGTLESAIEQKENELDAGGEDSPGQVPADQKELDGSFEETVEDAQETAEENAEDESQEQSGEPQDIVSERSRVLREGHATARENAAAEAEANQEDGE